MYEIKNILKKALSIIFLIFATPFVLYGTTEFFKSKDFSDLFVLIIFLIPFFISSKYLIINRNPSKRKLEKRERERLEKYKLNFLQLDDVEKGLYTSLINNILQHCYSLSIIINSTRDIKIFSNSFEELTKKLKLLSEHEYTGFFKNSLPSEDLKKIMENKTKTEILFIKRAFGNNPNRNIINDSKYVRYFKYFSPAAIDFITIGSEPTLSMQNDTTTHAENIENTENIISADYDNMEGHQFEHFCADILKKNGFENVEVTRGSGDQGIDILATKDGIKYGIQCKCYSSDIGNKAVQEAFSGKTFYHCHVASVLTNRHFTASAKELAESNGVLLWDRDYLNKLIENAN